MLEKRIGTIRNKGQKNSPLHQEFNIDDRSFEAILAYIVSYLRHVNFYTTENKIEGQWDVLVLNDPVIYMASIIESPVIIVVQENNEQETIQLLLDWYCKIQEWYQRLKAFNEMVLADKIKNIIADVLQVRKEDLMKQQEEGGISLSIPLDSYTINPETSVPEIAKTFEKSILHIQNFIKTYLKKNVFARQDHMPNNAMYIAFALLYKHVQKDINAIAKRHLDFYYKDVLKQTLGTGIPTKAIVSFIGKPKGNSFRIPSGVELSAGKLFESKEEILFKTTEPILVHPAELISLHTLYFNKNPYISAGTNKSLITNVLKKEIPIQNKTNTTKKRWPLFGADQDILVSSEIDQQTVGTMGFMIGAPILYLEEGKREISLRFNFEEETWKTTFWKLLQEVECNEELPLDIAFNKVFEEAFKIAYTTNEKWIPQDSYDVSFNASNGCFSIHLLLNSTALPMTSLSLETEQSEWPMIRVLLNEYAPVYVYSFFKGMLMESIEIDVTVSGIKNLSLYNNIGKMPLAKSFDLFGPQPSINDFLMIGKSELFRKELMHFNIHIDWENVPDDFGGFDTYYSEYSTPLTTASFQVNLQALSHGNWFPENQDQQQVFPLYTEDPCYSPEGYDTIRIATNHTIAPEVMGPFEFSRNYREKDPLKYDIHTESGFLKLSLVAPRIAFGNEIYQKDTAEILQNNAIRKESNPFPNPPFVPKVNRISLDYKASDIMYFNKSFAHESNADRVVGDFIHITPFENRKIMNGSQVYDRTMLHDFEGEGYLYMTLSGIDIKGAFSLYFDLWNSHPEHHRGKGRNITFQYRESTYWNILDSKYILDDGTHQLTQSGIVELIFPEHMEIHENDVYELRIMVKRDAYVYPLIGSVYPNAVETSCTDQNSQVIGRQIPADNIVKSVKKIPGVNGIIQPAASYSGKIPGTPDQFYIDVSQRLRHKDRAVTLKDYEQLVLQHFHEVVAVKCSNLNKDFESRSGKVSVVVLGEKWDYQNHWYFNLNQLKRIKDFIETKSNSYIDIQVRNPDVEWLVVNCVVQFHEKSRGGYYMEDLNRRINEYLCPLTQTNVLTARGIGGGIVPRMLMSYIEDLPYVAYVKKMDIEHIIKYGINDFSVNIHKENQEVRPTTPWAILAPEAKHNIFSPEVLEKNTLEIVETQNFRIGIDYVIVGDEGDEDSSEKEIIVPPVKPDETKKMPKLKGDTILNFEIK